MLMPTVIEVKELTHVYGAGMPFETVALDHISFSVEEGEFVGLIGHTGSGKSTLIQHMNGLLPPTSGQIIVEGTDITEKGVRLWDIRKKIGLVFQYPEYQLFEETIEKDVAFGPRNLGLSEEEALERARKAIELVGLSFDDIAKRSPFALSGGQRRRVAIAGVIAMEPKVLILDEPTAGLDPKAHGDILQMVESIRAERGITIILVSHNMEDVARLADKVLVMDGGRLAMSGTPVQVFSRAEELKELGLALPAAAEFMHRLAKRGAELGKPLPDTGALTIEEAEAAIVNWLAANKRV